VAQEAEIRIAIKQKARAMLSVRSDERFNRNRVDSMLRLRFSPVHDSSQTLQDVFRI
jgi:hypothetical protein